MYLGTLPLVGEIDIEIGFLKALYADIEARMCWIGAASGRGTRVAVRLAEKKRFHAVSSE